MTTYCRRWPWYKRAMHNHLAPWFYCLVWAVGHRIVRRGERVRSWAWQQIAENYSAKTAVDIFHKLGN